MSTAGHILHQSIPSPDACTLQLPAPKMSDRIAVCAHSIIDKQTLTPNSGDSTTPLPPQSTRSAAGFYLRWAIIVLNVGLELSQLTLTLEATGGKIKPPTYRALTAVTSSVCLLLSAVEVSHGVKPNGVFWKRKARRVGFAVWFGFVSSAVQFSVNVTALAVKKAVNFEYLGLLFAVCYFFSAINGDRGVHVAVVNCVSHGKCTAEGKFVDGLWLFECPRCTDGQIKLA